NQSVSGTSAIAESRSAHQCSRPDLADPSPMALARGERVRWRSIALCPKEKAGNPGRYRKHEACGHDRPPGSVVPESADWYNSSYIIAWDSNVPQTRTPDAHFFTEARYNGTKVVAVTP